jgi:hypothetical protein
VIRIPFAIIGKMNYFTIMKDEGLRWAMQGLSLHFNTVPDSWDNNGSAISCTEKN